MVINTAYPRAALGSGFIAHTNKRYFQRTWHFLPAAMHTENDKATVRRCRSPKDAVKKLDDAHNPKTQEAKKEMFRDFNRFSLRAGDDPIKVLNKREVLWNQTNGTKQMREGGRGKR